jgi:hypothetical protein
MLSPIRVPVFGFALLVFSFAAIPVAAQQQPAEAPVPPAIFSANKVFISNAGADSGLFPHPFSGSQDRVYNQFYVAMQQWGRYELVSDPNEADLVLELRLSGPIGPQNPDKAKGASDPLPIFYLTILDRKSHYTLWTMTESVSIAWLQKSHDRNFDDALGALVQDVKNLSAGQTAVKAKEALTQ